MTTARSTFAPGVARALPILLAQRLVLNTGGRMVFTYLPILAAGAGLSVAAMGRVVFARDMTGLLGPWIGRIVGRRGAWSTMTISSLLAVVGMALALTGPLGIALGLVLWGACRTAYLIASNSWIGDVVAYERRGRATGLVELTWAAAALVGLPLVGLAIGAFGWWAAPLSMAALGAPLVAWSALTPAPEGGTGRSAGDRRGRAAATLAPVGSAGRLRRATLVAIGAVSLLMGSAQFLFFTHGLWLADTYGFDATGVAFAIVAVGGAEALGSVGTLRITDMLGKRSAVVTGMVLLGSAQLTFAIVPAPPLAIGIALLVVAFLGSEFAIVSSIPLVSELEHDKRATVIGLSTGASTVARASVSLIAGLVYLGGGFRVTMLLAFGLGLVALAVLVLAVEEPSTA